MFAGITIEVDLDEVSAAIAADDDRCHAESLDNGEKVIPKGKHQSSSSARVAPAPAPRRQRLLLLAIDPLQSHAPLVTWPPRYLTPQTPVRIVSYKFQNDLDADDVDAATDAMSSGDDADCAAGPWRCVGEFRFVSAFRSGQFFVSRIIRLK